MVAGISHFPLFQTFSSLSNIFASFAFDSLRVMHPAAPLYDKRLWCFLSMILPDCPRARRVWDYCREKTSEMTFCSLFSPCLSCCLSPRVDTAGGMSDMLYCWQLLLSVCSRASVSVALMVFWGHMKALKNPVFYCFGSSSLMFSHCEATWLARKHSLCSIQFIDKCFNLYWNVSVTCTCDTWVHLLPRNHLWYFSTFNIRDLNTFPQVLFIWLTWKSNVVTHYIIWEI